MGHDCGWGIYRSLLPGPTYLGAYSGFIFCTYEFKIDWYVGTGRKKEQRMAQIITFLKAGAPYLGIMAIMGAYTAYLIRKGQK